MDRPGQNAAAGSSGTELRPQPRQEGGQDIVVDRVLADVRERGLDVLSPFPAGDYAAFRALEPAAAINRMRSLAAAQKGASREEPQA